MCFFLEANETSPPSIDYTQSQSKSGKKGGGRKRKSYIFEILSIYICLLLDFVFYTL